MDFVKDIFFTGLQLVGASILGVVSWFVYFFGFDASFFMSFLYAILTGAVAFIGVRYFVKLGHIRSSKLPYREYKYIRSHLRDGKMKINRIQKNMFRVGGFRQIMKNYDVVKTIRKIHSIVSKDPIRFYEIETFYYSHLNSLDELMARYVFLDSQPVKTDDIATSLKETKKTIAELSSTIDQDLKELLARDVKELQLEIEVAKKSIETKKDTEDTNK